jgi:GMP synthase (glutamine-hydrolysing)
LIEQGLFDADADHKAYVDELKAFQRDPGSKARAWRHGVGAAVLDPEIRERELSNWLEHAVLPAKSKRGRG